MRARSRPGFTLIELVIVVLIVGMLAAISIPQYNRTVEVTKGENAISVVQMVGAANRMWKLDKGAYAVGSLDGCPAGNPGATSLQCTKAMGSSNACYLMYCGYLATQEFNSNGTAYQYSAVDGSATGSCGSASGGKFTACAVRRTGSGAGSSDSCYNNWSFAYDTSGVVKASPIPSSSAKCEPPSPPS